MILVLRPTEIELATNGVKRSDLVTDPRDRWKVGSRVHFYTDWPARGGIRKGIGKCNKVLYAEFVLRDNYCNLYLSHSPQGSYRQVIMDESDEMEILAREEGYEDRDSFFESYFPGWKAADPDEWRYWNGKMIFW